MFKKYSLFVRNNTKNKTDGVFIQILPYTIFNHSTPRWDLVHKWCNIICIFWVGQREQFCRLRSINVLRLTLLNINANQFWFRLRNPYLQIFGQDFSYSHSAVWAAVYLYEHFSYWRRIISWSRPPLITSLLPSTIPQVCVFQMFLSPTANHDFPSNRYLNRK